MRKIFLILGLSVFFVYCKHEVKLDNNTTFEEDVLPRVIEKRDNSKDERKPEFVIKEKLGKPFGTFIKLKVAIFDGDSLYTKSAQGNYLMRILSVDDKRLIQPLIMEFEDQSGKFPVGDSELQNYLLRMKNGELSKNEFNEKIDMYVGSEYEVVAYETGEFSGLPYGGDFEFSQTPQGKEFHFRNYLVILADLAKKG